MKIANLSPEQLTEILIARISDMDARERIVLKFPFASEYNRIEIYCGETYVKGSAYGGETLSGITKVQVFKDSGNKDVQCNSYSYLNDLLGMVPNIVKFCMTQIPSRANA
jgi:hypothetical protein